MGRKQDRILQFFNSSRRPPSLVQLPVSPNPTHVGPSTPSSRTTSVSQVSSITPSEDRVKVVAGVAWEGVKAALVLLKECSGWLPPLKAATAGFIALIDAIELTSANIADLGILRQSINGLTSTIREGSQDRRFPWLRRRLVEFADKLNEIVKSIDEKLTHGTPRRFAEGKKDEEDIAVFSQAISVLITNLQSELTLYTCRGMNELLSNESLKKLNESETAHYDAPLNTKLVQRRGCTLNTRQKILEDLMDWAKNPRSSRLYWMNGMAGTGKTTIAYSFCEQLQEKGLLGANFFCSRSLAECSDIRHIIPTTARQLARSCPQYAPALLEALGGDFQLPPFKNHLSRLLLEPFHLISESVTDTLIIVIDALDECNNEARNIRFFLKLLCDYFVSETIPLKVFVTSRPEGAICHAITPLKPCSPSEWAVVHIHDIEESLVQADIKVYVEDELAEVAETWGLEDCWPPSMQVDIVVGNANKLFIYAATVIRYVREDSGDPCARLSELASTSRVGGGTSQNLSLTTELIDGLYRSILGRALHQLNRVENQLVQAVLKLVVCAQTPLTLAGIATLLNSSGEFEFEIPTSRVRTALKFLPSVISTPPTDDGVATTFHASFTDFLFDSHRCGTINHIPRRETYQDLARMCLNLMDRSLTIDNITRSYRWQTVDELTKQTESYISSTLGYACMFWGSYLDTNDAIGNLSMELDRFLTHHVLRWLEVLSLLKRLDIGVEVLQRIKECNHFGDAYKFLKDIFDIIKVWPCELFHSGLVWAPTQSFIRKTYAKTSLIRIVRGHRLSWGACEHAIRSHSGPGFSVAVSPNNRHIISGCFDNTVRVWNALTGEEEHVLRGHNGCVDSVAVSPDSHYIVSGSNDKTVRIWSLPTGEEGHVLRGHFGPVFSVAVSPDNRYIVSGSEDNIVRIWNLLTGEEEHVLRGHSDSVDSVTVSPDNRHIISGSHDKTIRIWKLSTGEEGHVLRAHSGPVFSVAVFPDNRYIVSGSEDKTIRIWNLSTGEEGHVLRGHSGQVYSVAVSPDNRYIVSGSKDSTIRVWDASTGEEEHVLRGHSSWVKSLAFSPDQHHIISGSFGNTVRIWNLSTVKEEHALEGHSGSVFSVAVSPDNRHIVSGSKDHTVRIWDSSTGEEEYILRGHSDFVHSVVVSPDNHRIVSGANDKTVRTWNLSTGEEEHVLRGHSKPVFSVAVSPDSRYIVSGSEDKTIRIWNLPTGEEGHVLRGHSGQVYSVAVSPNSRYIVSGSNDYTVRVWNASTGEEEHVLRGHSSQVFSLAVSPDNRYIVSGSADKTIRIWNLSTGEQEPLLVISFDISSNNYHVMSGPQVNTAPIERVFLSAMTTSIPLRLLAQGADIASIPVLQALASGANFPLEVLLQAIGNGLPTLIPITLAPDRMTLLLSNGTKCLAIPSSLRDIMCAAFFGSKAYFGHGSGLITILDISTTTPGRQHSLLATL